MWVTGGVDYGVGKSSSTVLIILKQFPVLEEGVELGHLLEVNVFARDQH